MPPNSISLNFEKMPTVTVDGKTHTFKPGDKPDEGFKPITQGGVTYSLVKDAKGHFQMTITGEPGRGPMAPPPSARPEPSGGGVVGEAFGGAAEAPELVDEDAVGHGARG